MLAANIDVLVVNQKDEDPKFNGLRLQYPGRYIAPGKNIDFTVLFRVLLFEDHLDQNVEIEQLPFTLRLAVTSSFL